MDEGFLGRDGGCTVKCAVLSIVAPDARLISQRVADPLKHAKSTVCLFRRWPYGKAKCMMAAFV